MQGRRSDSGSLRRLDVGNLYWLTDGQMERLCPFFPKSHGKPTLRSAAQDAARLGHSMIVYRDELPLDG